MILDGSSKSTTFMSLEKRDIIRPDGVVSKNEIGARTMPNNSRRCIAVAAIKPPSHGTTSTVNDEIAATKSRNEICTYLKAKNTKITDAQLSENGVYLMWLQMLVVAKCRERVNYVYIN